MGREEVHWHAHDDLVRGRKADGILRSIATTVSCPVAFASDRQSFYST